MVRKKKKKQSCCLVLFNPVVFKLVRLSPKKNNKKIKIERKVVFKVLITITYLLCVTVIVQVQVASQNNYTNFFFFFFWYSLIMLFFVLCTAELECK